MRNSKILLSFIIPAYNEEKFIGEVIDSIIENVKGKFSYEIILVDNGSTDRTVSIARKKGARVLKNTEGTIAALRNAGARIAKGEILVFLDADVLLTEAWGAELERTIPHLDRYPMTITGSICGVQDAPGWIEKYWFSPITSKNDVNYLNSGHLIIRRNTFQLLGNWPEDIETGEDYEFCRKARKRGCLIVNNPKLRVIHLGYPRSIVSFFKREKWHGKGDYRSLKLFLNSKPAILSIFFLVLLFSGVLLSLGTNNVFWLILPFIYLIGISMASSFYRLRILEKSLLPVACLYTIYFSARSASFLDVVLEALLVRRQGKKGGTRS